MRINMLIVGLITILMISVESTAKLRYSVGGGLRTVQILGTNPNNSPMLQRDTLKEQYIGGGFTQTNSGIVIAGFLEFGETADLVMPFGFEYSEYIALERIPISPRTTAYLRNTVAAPSLFVGMNYKFFTFPFAGVRAYTGIELNTNFFQSTDFYRKIEYGNLDSNFITQIKTKTPATRIGGDIKLGFDGPVYQRLFINASIALSAANLLFRDDNRGELMTPSKLDESKENIMFTFRFGLFLRYYL